MHLAQKTWEQNALYAHGCTFTFKLRRKALGQRNILRQDRSFSTRAIVQ